MYLVEYLSVIGKHSKQSPELPLPQQRIAKYGELASMLSRAYKEAARRANLESGKRWVEVASDQWPEGRLSDCLNEGATITSRTYSLSCSKALMMATNRFYPAISRYIMLSNS